MSAARSWLMPHADEDTEEVVLRARSFLGLLARFADAESIVDRGTTNRALEQDAWRGVEILARQARADVDSLSAALEKAATK